MTSPLRAPIEAMLASRAVGSHRPKHALNSVDQDMAPSYLSQQHSALVQGWDYAVSYTHLTLPTTAIV